jgi:hypothetical protein
MKKCHIEITGYNRRKKERRMTEIYAGNKTFIVDNDEIKNCKERKGEEGIQGNYYFVGVPGSCYAIFPIIKDRPLTVKDAWFLCESKSGKEVFHYNLSEETEVLIRIRHATAHSPIELTTWLTGK